MATESYLMTAKQVSEELQCSVAHAYKLVREMNNELAENHYLVIAGKVPRPYFKKKFYGFQNEG